MSGYCAQLLGSHICSAPSHMMKGPGLTSFDSSSNLTSTACHASRRDRSNQAPNQDPSASSSKRVMAMSRTRRRSLCCCNCNCLCPGWNSSCFADCVEVGVVVTDMRGHMGNRQHKVTCAKIATCAKMVTMCSACDGATGCDDGVVAAAAAVVSAGGGDGGVVAAAAAVVSAAVGNNTHHHCHLLLHQCTSHLPLHCCPHPEAFRHSNELVHAS